MLVLPVCSQVFLQMQHGCSLEMGVGGWGGGEKPTLVHDGIMLEHHDTEHGIYVAHFYLCVLKMWKGLYN